MAATKRDHLTILNNVGLDDALLDKPQHRRQTLRRITVLTIRGSLGELDQSELRRVWVQTEPLTVKLDSTKISHDQARAVPAVHQVYSCVAEGFSRFSVNGMFAFAGAFCSATEMSPELMHW